MQSNGNKSKQLKPSNLLTKYYFRNFFLNILSERKSYAYPNTRLIVQYVRNVSQHILVLTYWHIRQTGDLKIYHSIWIHVNVYRWREPVMIALAFFYLMLDVSNFRNCEIFISFLEYNNILYAAARQYEFIWNRCCRSNAPTLTFDACVSTKMCWMTFLACCTGVLSVCRLATQDSRILVEYWKFYSGFHVVLIAWKWN